MLRGSVGSSGPKSISPNCCANEIGFVGMVSPSGFKKVITILISSALFNAKATYSNNATSPLGSIALIGFPPV